MRVRTADRILCMKRGFTLIELLVVVAIIGILATVILVSLSASREKSRNASVVAQVAEVQKALELYFVDNSLSYPNETASCIGSYSDNLCWNNNNVAVNASFNAALAPYLDITSFNIDNNLRFSGARYQAVNSGLNYRIYYFLEGTDQECPKGVFFANYGGIATACQIDV